jgi:hypothetical protein
VKKSQNTNNGPNNGRKSPALKPKRRITTRRQKKYLEEEGDDLERKFMR